MTTLRHRILWKNLFVGYIEAPTRWPAIWRGKWLPGETPATDEFLTALALGRFLWVAVELPDGQEVFATIEVLPVDEIELRLSIDEQDTLQINPDAPEAADGR
jgi:hypothetical protein